MPADHIRILAKRVDNSSLCSEEDTFSGQSASGPTEHSDSTCSANSEVTSEHKWDPLLPNGSELSESIHDDQPQKLSKDRLAIAGIDLGTAVSRATLAHGELCTHYDVPNPECPPCFANNYASFECPALVDITNGKMGYDTSAAGIPIKALMYELVHLEAPPPRNDMYMGVNFCLLRQRGMSDANMSVLRDKRRLRELVVKYFEKIRHALMICCTKNKLFYESVAITIPALWNATHFMRLFIGILADVFTFIPKRNIFLIPKTEAIGCIVTSGITMGQVREPRSNLPYPDEIMVVDFGRHALHVTSLTLVWDNTKEHRVNSNAAFFAPEASWGMLGGMELYAQLTEDAIRDSISGNPAIANHAEKEERIAELMADFRQKCPNLGRNPFTLNSSRGDWQSGTLAPGLWDTAFRDPLEAVQCQMRERVRTRLPTIVSLTGDSYRNQAVLERTMAEVRKYVKYGWKLFTPFDNVRRVLAVWGAAWAVRQRQDVRTLLDTSDLRFLFRKVQEPHKQWKFRSEQETEVKLHRHSIFWMTCAPYASAPRKHVYKLVNFGHRRRGKYVIRREVGFDEERQQYTLVLEECKLDKETGKQVYRAKWDIPIYYDVGRRIPLLDGLNFDLERLEPVVQ